MPTVESAVFPAVTPDNATDFFALKAPLEAPASGMFVS
jgi:hypothetical protein